MTTGTTTIRLNDFSRLWKQVGGDVESAVRRVGQSGWYVLGQEVSRFENMLAETLGVSHAVGCASGLDAIEIALRALDIKPGDRVLTTPISAFATTLAIVRAGGIPVYVDVDRSGLMDLGRVDQTLSQDETIKFMVVVHLYGQPMDMKCLAELKMKYAVRIVEDAAQAIMASRDGHAIGSVGDAAALSFYPTKNIGTLGDGGAVLTTAKSVYERAAVIRDCGQVNKYDHQLMGMNSRLDELHAAILADAMLPRCEAWTQRRRSIAKQYLNAIDNDHVVLPRWSDESGAVWHLFSVMVAPEHRASFETHLAKRGIATGRHYPFVIPETPAMRDCHPVILDPLIQARRLSVEQVSLPIHPFLRDDEVERVTLAVNHWVPA